jgi:hypothetical protein
MNQNAMDLRSLTGGTTVNEAHGLLERSNLYREFAAEREEILRHKWLLSEKAGQDIGFEAALVSWVVNHRCQWRKERRFAAQAVHARQGATGR